MKTKLMLISIISFALVAAVYVLTFSGTPSASLTDREKMEYLHESNANPIPVTGGSPSIGVSLTDREKMEYLHEDDANPVPVTGGSPSTGIALTDRQKMALLHGDNANPTSSANPCYTLQYGWVFVHPCSGDSPIPVTGGSPSSGSSLTDRQKMDLLHGDNANPTSSANPCYTLQYGWVFIHPCSGDSPIPVTGGSPSTGSALTDRQKMALLHEDNANPTSSANPCYTLQYGWVFIHPCSSLTSAR